MSPLDGIRDEVRELRSDLREDVSGLHSKLDAFFACYATHHTETRERLAALEAVQETPPSSKSRTVKRVAKKYAPHAGVLATLLAIASEVVPAIADALSTPSARASTSQEKKP